METIDNLQISELSSGSISLSNDLFMISERISDRVFLSKKIEYSAISSDIVDSIENIPSFHPSGKWNFHDGLGIQTKTITKANNENLSSCVVNVEYLSNAFTNLFNKLSSEIYVKKHIPSVVGELIYSTTLKNETMVKKYYGDYTSWVQVPGRIVLATGGQNLIYAGIKGGEEEHVLTLNEIPAHQHKFVPAKNRKTLTASVSLEAEEGKEILEAGNFSARYEDIPPTNNYAVTKEKEQHPDSKVDKGGVVYGNSGAEVLIQPELNKSKPHNNMPPFYSVYVWRRIQ